jgi:succinate dehydrogenase hydrophobic anchor subunit
LIPIVAASSKPINNDVNTKSDSTVKTESVEKGDVAKAEKGIDLTVGSLGNNSFNATILHIVEQEGKPSKEPVVEEGYEFGAYHWNMERGAAVALIPLMSTQFIYGAHPVVDGLLGVVLPYHIYMGFDSCITDYIPKRVYPRLHKFSNWTLAGSTALVMWGCYEFNTNEIGITEFASRIFTA